MTRPALDAMTPADVAKARWGLFAKRLAPDATYDFDSALEQIADEEKPPTTTSIRVRRGARRESLMQGKARQATIREVLLLDDESADDDEVAV